MNINSKGLGTIKPIIITVMKCMKIPNRRSKNAFNISGRIQIGTAYKKKIFSLIMMCMMLIIREIVQNIRVIVVLFL